MWAVVSIKACLPVHRETSRWWALYRGKKYLLLCDGWAIVSIERSIFIGSLVDKDSRCQLGMKPSICTLALGTWDYCNSVNAQWKSPGVLYTPDAWSRDCHTKQLCLSTVTCPLFLKEYLWITSFVFPHWSLTLHLLLSSMFICIHSIIILLYPPCLQQLKMKNRGHIGGLHG